MTDGGGVFEPLLTREEARAADASLIARGVPGVVLMENAGRGAADAVLGWMRERGARTVSVLAGPGNNGGDGYVLARHLALTGLPVGVWSVADPAGLRGDAAVMRDAWRAVGGSLGVLPTDAGELSRRWPEFDADVLVDALFGTGLSRPLEGSAREAVRLANAAERARALSVALDVPSGLDVETGAPLGDEAWVFRATHTLTFGAGKPGLYTGAGRRLSGRVSVVNIGAPLGADVLAGAHARLSRRAPLAPRALDAHKGDNGRTLIVAGSPGMTGAAVLCARAAHRAGAGLVTVATRAPAALEAKTIETMTMPLPDEPSAAAATLAAALPRFDAVAVGPGMGRDDWARAVLDVVLKSGMRAVLDADALNLLAERGGLSAAGPRVLTPHPLEMARLLGSSDAAAVNADRVAAARACAARYGSVAVLKGAGTVIAEPGGRVTIADAAEPALGVAGSGDVLTGVVVARLAERSPSVDVESAAICAVLAHARAGQAVRAARGSSRGALASEIADAVAEQLERP